MARLVLEAEDHLGNAINNFAIEVLAADPAGGDLYAGRIWLNSVSDEFKGYNGTGIAVLGGGAGGAVESLTVDDASIEDIGTASDPSIRVKALGITNAMLAGSIDNAKLATNPLARANHTGTQLAATISDLAATVQAYRLDQFAAPTSALSLNSQRITGLADPSASTDAANKQYVDAAVAGLAWKEPVVAATTANVTLATDVDDGSTLDGVTLATGDRILVKNQTASEENGIYVVAASGAPARATDADSAADLQGAAVFVDQGTSNANTLWTQTVAGAITVGTTGLTWTQFGGPGEYLAGTGLTKTGNTFSLTTPVSVANGGTGAGTAAGARTALGAVGWYAEDIGDGSTTSIVVTHNLGTRDVVVSVKQAGTPWAEVYPEIRATSINTVTLLFATAPTTDQYRVTIQAGV